MSLKQTHYGHNPVLNKVVENYLQLKKGDTVIDCTLGLGGHSELFLEKIGKNGTLVAFELDEKNLKIASNRLKDIKNKNKILFIHKNFAHLKNEVEERGITNVKLIFFDLGLSSPQVDEADRGFSFMKQGPLDMRFDKNQIQTAEMILKAYSEKQLEQIFREYGEERMARKYARIIKENLPIETTTQLAQLIERYAPRPPKKGKKVRKHPATQVFQALRIAVNNEIESLKIALTDAINVLDSGGRLIVISYHSLEDRIVKNIIRTESKECLCPKEIPICQCNHKPQVKIITKKPIVPDEEEIEENPRARSAKMRVAEKI
ncbi:16S rRNA (cytosine(1402)-N(4))-methyltransferase RsmH [Patescibacteria group bacterium]